MIAWFARNKVAANLLMVSIIFFGMTLATNTPVEIFPSTQSDTIVVQVTYPGATPEDVERGVVTRVENALQGVEGIDKIESSAAEGSGKVLIEVERYYDPERVLNEVKTKVDAINTFPQDIERPVIRLADFFFEVITVIISGDFSEKEISHYAEQVRDELELLPGVSQLELGYVREREINIEVSQDTIRTHNLSLNEIAAAVGRSSVDLSAGNLRTGSGDLLLRTRGQAYEKGDFDRIKIRSYPDGGSLSVSDVASVRDGFVDDKVHAFLDDEPAAIISVNRVARESAIQVARQVRNYLERKQPELPTGMRLSYWDDNSKIVRDRLSTLVNNAIQGSALILLLLALFLHPRVAFWVFIGLPVSFSGAFIIMWLTGTTINIVSLFSFILVLGVVVDDAIVTGENIYRHSGFSKNGTEAAINGTKEIAVPVTYGVITTMVAFLPMGFIEGARSSIFTQLPLVVIPALIFSWIESKLILPAHLSNFKEMSERAEANKGTGLWTKARERVVEGFESMVLNYYRPALSQCIRHRYLFVTFFLSILFLCVAVIASGWLRFVFIPRVQSEEVMVQFKMPKGTPYGVNADEVSRIALHAEELQRKYVDPKTNKSIIKHIFSAAGDYSGSGISGNGGNSSGVVIFELVAPENNHLEVDSRALLAEWRSMVGPISGAESVSYRAELGGFGQPLAVQFSGSDLKTLKEAALEFRQFLSGWSGVYDIGDDLSDGKEELRVELLPEGRALGLTRLDVARQVRRAFYGYEVQRVQRGRNDIRVKVRFPTDERRSIHDISSMLIATPDGGNVPFARVATLHFDKGPAVITRINRLRTVNVTADIDKGALNMQSLQRAMDQYLRQMMPRYPGLRYQYEGELLEQQESIGSIAQGFMFALIAIYCCLAIPFRSYVQPFIVMTIIPFGLIGVVAGHLLLGIELSMMSVLGTLALIGVVVNDSLVLVDFTNRNRGPGKRGLLRAVKRAGVMRLRPVVLTSLTTFIGLLPLLFDGSTQAQFLKPMAISLGFGVLFASTVTLFLVPINYLILEDIKQILGSLKRQFLEGGAAVDSDALTGSKTGSV